MKCNEIVSVPIMFNVFFWKLYNFAGNVFFLSLIVLSGYLGVKNLVIIIDKLYHVKFGFYEMDVVIC